MSIHVPTSPCSLPPSLPSTPHGAVSASPLSHLTRTEADVLRGVLQTSNKAVADCMLPWDKVVCLSAHAKVDNDTLRAIGEAGYSRIPVCRSGGLKGQEEGQVRTCVSFDVCGVPLFLLLLHVLLPSFLPLLTHSLTHSSSLPPSPPPSSLSLQPSLGRGMDPSLVCGYLLTKHLIGPPSLHSSSSTFSTTSSSSVPPSLHTSPSHASSSSSSSFSSSLVKSLPLRCPLVVSLDCPLHRLLPSFQQGHAHLALVVASRPYAALRCLLQGRPLNLEGEEEEEDEEGQEGGREGGRVVPVGIVTLEDVMEEVLQTKIWDEKDRPDRHGELLLLPLPPPRPPPRPPPPAPSIPRSLLPPPPRRPLLPPLQQQQQQQQQQ